MWPKKSVLNILLFAVIIVSERIISTKAEWFFKTTKIECLPNPQYFTNHSCTLKPVNRYKTVAFMEGVLKNPLRNISINIALWGRNDANIYRPFLINMTHNACNILEKKVAKGFFLATLLKILGEYTNINHSCPLTGSLVAKNLYIDVSGYPELMRPPNKFYKIVLLFYEGYPLDYVGTLEMYAEVLMSKTHKILTIN